VRVTVRELAGGSVRESVRTVVVVASTSSEGHVWAWPQSGLWRVSVSAPVPEGVSSHRVALGLACDMHGIHAGTWGVQVRQAAAEGDADLFAATALVNPAHEGGRWVGAVELESLAVVPGELGVLAEFLCCSAGRRFR